jgi:hypothetical protein
MRRRPEPPPRPVEPASSRKQRGGYIDRAAGNHPSNDPTPAERIKAAPAFPWKDGRPMDGYFGAEPKAVMTPEAVAAKGFTDDEQLRTDDESGS